MTLLSPTVRVALLALRRKVLRSALTTLGIVIGVGAVIAMVEIGQGSKRAVAEMRAREARRSGWRRASSAPSAAPVEQPA